MKMSTAYMRRLLILLIILLGMVIIPSSLISGLGALAAQAETRAAVQADAVIEQVGPPWYNTDWHYRMPVVISNSGGVLYNYQVLVKLDNSNFDFSHANMDGADVRFTNTDGSSDLPFWMESYSNTIRLAYFWVKVPVVNTGNTTIYLYYGNTAAITTTSNGEDTFDFFDDN